MEKSTEQKVIDILGGIDGAKKYIEDENNGHDIQLQYDMLFEMFMEIPEIDGGMPYGTAKARTGDPYQWIYNFVCKSIKELDK